MHSAQAAALAAALLPFVSPSSLTAQTSPKSDVVQRIVLLDHTLPDRDALRAAIRAHDPAAAAQAANEVESGARLARREFEDALERVRQGEALEPDVLGHLRGVQDRAGVLTRIGRLRHAVEDRTPLARIFKNAPARAP